MAIAQQAEAGAKATLTVFSGTGDDPVLDPWPEFPPEDTISGAVDHRGKVLFRDPKKRYSVGVWQCEPAKFIEPYPGTESGHVLAGRATLTNEATGESITLKAGDHLFHRIRPDHHLGGPRDLPQGLRHVRRRIRRGAVLLERLPVTLTW